MFHRVIPLICGIDLAGIESRPTGICLLHTQPSFHTLHADSEILTLIRSTTPSLVAIDAPLSFSHAHFRDGDSELRKKYPILPLTFAGMQKLAQRGISMKSNISPPVIEVYPHASKQVLEITSKQDLLSYGFPTLPATIHELDAAVAALTGLYYLQGKYTAYGIDDPIILPAK
jgi:predicted nuclease with RNAse H fold